MEPTATDILRAPREERRPRPTLPVVKKLYRMNELVVVVGRCRAAIYADIRAGQFPRPIRLGPRSSAWLCSEVEQWLEQRAAERDRERTSPAA